VLSVARQACGPNVVMWGAEIFAKPPGIGKATPWHQDIYTPAVKPKDPNARSSAMSIWIAVDDVGLDNGCLRFIPRSGAKGALTHLRQEKTDALLNFNVDGADFDESSAVDSILAPGHFSLHDLYVVHGAKPNTSGRRRAAVTLHYMSAEDLYDRSYGSAVGSGLSKPAPMARRPIWLVLGENQNPGNDFTTGHENLKDLDAWAEESRQRCASLLQ
jgi:ectoine hydroxylase-related dioxygenase (phytanoyl-CoA dioxygenase family)